MSDALYNYLELAKRAAITSGEHLQKRQNIRVDENLERDIKLSSDKESERIIIDRLKPSGLPILSEECGLIGSRSGLHWIVDPLDGTVNYYKGMDDLCCVSIALFDKNEPVLGVINRYKTGELFAGAANEYAELNDSLISASGVKILKDAVFATGFPSGTDYSDDSILQFIRRVQRVKKVRMLGSAAIMAVLVACGKIDAYFEQDIRLWDIAAAAAIVQAAGGVVKIAGKTDDSKCDFGAFATKELMEEFYGT